jgi:pyruvate kinase
MLDKIFKNNIKNDVIIFTDTKKTYTIAKFYKNAKCIITNKFNNKNISKFYYDNIKKNKKIIFNRDDNAFLITISFPKKGSVANTLSFINKKDF